ncbi:hypothetical protein HH308_17170 [Gordonia sp. TBRC 11910]|uniref:FAD-binding domain-containing protein n=1 Tax=Gordonia asplenii TaxID=2725283 RepID=A0A848L1I7_9ACTN|nr:FAD-dependent monooxygenase [Gordonia asplenii]NMO02945.1 hypothetical protein [Gordonia asplenii]
MTHRTIAIIGGGPAGLFAARLIKLNQPDADVTVYERNGQDTATFGFGVGLTESTMSNIDRADPAAAERIRNVSRAGHDLKLRDDAGDIVLHGARNLAIGRAELLVELNALALDAGVRIEYGTRIGVDDLDADVIVAADGVRSATRARFADQLGVRETLGRGRYMWCGIDFAVDSAFFAARTRGDALFVTHAYPYTEDRSTFLLEADDETFETAGLAAFDAATPVGESDTASLDLLSEVFSDDLKQRPLLANRSRWARFSTIGLDRWSTGNVVLLGDAAHTAHYTLGSGTKLALEDAIALADGLAGHADVADAFAAYEAARRPSVDRFKLLAGRSQRWWESYRLRHAQPAELIAMSYMTRAGNLTVADFAAHEPTTAATALRSLGAEPPTEPSELDDWILSRAATFTPEQVTYRLTWTEPDVWGAAADDAVASIPSGGVVEVSGPDDTTSVGARIDFAERLRLTGHARSIVVLPNSFRSQAAAAIATGRTDAVIFEA